MACPVCNRDTEIQVRSTVYSDVFKREYEVRECTVCHTKECHPQLTDADLKEYYTEEEIVGAGKYEKWNGKYRYIYEWITRHLPEKGSVIEIGCNSGNQLRYFKEQGWTSFGLEFSEDMQASTVNDAKSALALLHAARRLGQLA